MKKLTYKDFVTGKQKWTRGRFAQWTEPTGLLSVRYAVIVRGRSELLIPEYCLSADSKRAIEYELKCRDVPERLLAECKLDRPSVPRKHLFAVNPKRRQGFFLVNTPDRVVTKEALREMFTEASDEGLERPLHIYCACSMIAGPGIDIIQVGVND